MTTRSEDASRSRGTTRSETVRATEKGICEARTLRAAEGQREARQFAQQRREYARRGRLAQQKGTPGEEISDILDVQIEKKN